MLISATSFFEIGDFTGASLLSALNCLFNQESNGDVKSNLQFNIDFAFSNAGFLIGALFALPAYIAPCWKCSRYIGVRLIHCPLRCWHICPGSISHSLQVYVKGMDSGGTIFGKPALMNLPDLLRPVLRSLPHPPYLGQTHQPFF